MNNSANANFTVAIFEYVVVETSLGETLILGAGPAGLSAGYYLSQAGIDMCLIEAASEPGGYARTFHHGQFKYDAGAHRFHDKDAEITRDVKQLMGADLLEVHAPSQISWNGRFLDFPLSPANVARRIGPLMLIRAGFDLLRARLSGQHEVEENFATNAYHRYGKTIADAFLIGYSEKLWGLPSAQLMKEVSGGRLQGLKFRTMLYELLHGAKRKTEHLDGSFYYPRQGYGQIAERLASEIGPERIRTNCRITRIFHDGKRIKAVQLNESEIVFSERIVNTLASLQFLKLMDPAPPETIIASATSLKFRDLILVALFLNRPSVSQNASIYFPSTEIPFTRLYEPKNRSVELAPQNQTCVVVEIPCIANDESWHKSDVQLCELVKEHLIKAQLINQQDVTDFAIHRLKMAYPILELGKDRIVGELSEYLQRFTNLHTVGRAGRFEYTHVHDLLRQGKELAKLLTAEAQAPVALDNVLLQYQP